MLNHPEKSDVLKLLFMRQKNNLIKIYIANSSAVKQQQ